MLKNVNPWLETAPKMGCIISCIVAYYKTLDETYVALEDLLENINEEKFS